MNMSEFKKLQRAQMQIMDEVHRVCSENGICYYIIGGTALGARRHGGFIPWDVDIDIAMPREDYEKFADISSKKLLPNFSYKDYKNTSHFTHPHALVCMNNTYLYGKFSKFNTGEVNLGIYLDVFPLDKAPENKKLQNKQALKLRKLRRLKAYKLGYRYNNDKKKALLKKVVSSLIFWTNIDKLNEAFDKECRKYQHTDSKYLCSMSSHYSYEKQCMNQEIYGNPNLVKFEDRQYYAPQQIDKYLEKIYGDFLKLPPESEQKANLDVFDRVIFCDETNVEK